ncbi:MAG: DUF6812 domain-containing protein [Chloroflexota bacterium]
MTSLSDRTVSLAERASGLASRVAEHPRDLQRVLLVMMDGAEITGLLHRAPGTRTLDYLNRQAEAFVAMTEATVRRADRTDEVPFIAINKVHILRVIEADLD